MANQEELQRITDSTIREMAAVIESHNRNYQDPEEAALREEIENMKKEIQMVDKTIKVRELSNEKLKIKLLQVQQRYKKVVKQSDDKLKSLKTTTKESDITRKKLKTFYRDAMQKWGEKKEKYIIITAKLKDYVGIVLEKLQEYGITHDGYMTESDETESDESDDYDVNRQEQYESDTQFEDDGDDDNDGEDESANRFHFIPSPHQTSIPKSQLRH